MKKLLKQECHPIGIPKFNLKVKLTTFLFLLVLMQGQANSYSQNTKISLSLNDVTIQSVLDEIESKTEFKFFVDTDIIDLSKKVSVTEKEKRISNVLEKLFKDTNIVFKVVGKQIVLKPDPSKRNTPQIPNNSKTEIELPQKTISGTVTDEENIPLSGASIVIKGSTTGVAADFDGNFNIQASMGDILVVSYIGYNLKEITVTDQTEFTVVLTASNELEEVVVVGYGTTKRVNLSGAVGGVDSKILENRPVSNVAAALQGSIGNLNISPGSGRATDAPSINVRGFGTLSGGGNPLILVDNVAISEQEVSWLNPNDIESVTVLKDAASSAIYGARAAFGVILITTKSAKSGTIKKPTISVNAFNTVRSIRRLPKLETDPFVVMSYKNIMARPWYNLYNTDELNYAQLRSDDPSVPAVILNPQDPEYWSYYGTTDWMSEAYKKASFSQTANISISGSSDNVRYYLSGQFFNQEGAFRYGADVLTRSNFRAKLDIDLTSWLEVNSNISYLNSRYEQPVDGTWDYFHGINRIPTLSVIKNPDDSWTYDGAWAFGRLMEGGRSKEVRNFLQLTTGLKAKLLKDELTFNVDFSTKSGNNYTKGYRVPVEYKEGPNITKELNNGNSSVNEYDSRDNYFVFNAYTNYNKTFDEHDLRAMVGVSREFNRFGSNSMNRSGLLNNNIPSIGLATDDPTVGTSTREWAINSLFYRLNYTLKSKYILEFNAREDFSSRFAVGNRRAFTPSASGAWIVSNESFFQDALPWIDHFKLRGSYGTLGNQNVGEYSYIPSMGSGKTGPILDGTQPVYVSAPGLVDANITWEEVTTANYGIDVYFLKSNLNASFDFYKRETIGMLTKGQSLPAVLGAGVPLQNAADLETKGFEFGLNYKDFVSISGKPFNYSAKFILSDNKTFITKFENPTGTLDDYYVGKELGEIWGLTNAPSFFQSQDEIDNHADQTPVTSYPGTRPIEPGDLKFEDLNGDGIVNWGDWTLDDHGDYKVIGNSSNRYSYSLDLSGDWKGFDFRMYMQGIGKKDFYPGPGQHYFWGVYAQPWSNIYAAHLDNWTPENRDAYFPRLKSYTAESGRDLGINQTKYMQNAAYLRMKNITVGYSLPNDVTNKFGIERLRFYLSGEDLFEFTKLVKRLDPEALDGRSYPFQRTYSMGINIMF
ncbi:TonB-dependent receptor [Arenibacter certesii]|uniref:SusC/RagA family TonB-linked outer membrane protein n=1 Tax=Arenibacter certesii TaxID=228955 RepID=A0A918MP93_9FLAO|nr:TonB-dependent receptor [Arenibacter certesii]GGW45888.1 SusC/RagA family TonB-linked outer membrane protein [Arenibacter certesii]